MMRLLATAALSLFMVVGAANAEQFYRKEAGQWSVEGFKEEQTICAATTYWDNGSYVSFFITIGGGANVMIHNKEWNIGDPLGSYKGYQATLRFFGKYNPDEGVVDYKLQDNQTVVLLNVNEKFLESWTKYDTMVLLMPGDIGQMTVGLGGTNEIVGYMGDCLNLADKKNAPQQNL